MSLRSTYLAINLLALAILSTALYFLYQDGQASLKQEEDFSTQKLNNTLTFIKTINSLESYLDEPSPMKSQAHKKLIIKGLAQYQSSLPRWLEPDKIAAELMSKLDRIDSLREGLVMGLQALDQTQKSLLSYRNKVEEAVANKAKKIMTNQKELAPDLKDTLGSWSATFPFLDKIRKRVDLTYLKDDDVEVLNKVLNFSQWFSKKLLQEINNPQLTKENLNQIYQEAIARLDAIHNTKVQTPGNIEVLYIKKDLRQMFSKWENLLAQRLELSKNSNQLRRAIESARENEEKKLISLWQDNYLVKTKEKTKQRSKHYSLIMNSAFFIVASIIILSLFLFLKIFPQLKELEKKANAMAKGDFSTSFSKIPNNEIGTLMRSFNSMSLQLSVYIDKVAREEKEKASLAQSVQEMRHLSEMGEAAAKMAHDLKNPISILQFCLKDIKDNLAQTTNEDLKNILNSDLEKSLVALDKLKLASEKLAIGRQEITKERFLLKDLLKDTLSLFKARLEEQEITSELIFEDDSSTQELFLPKLELMGGLSNLVVNAIESYDEVSSQEFKHLKISTKRVQDSVEVSVANSGNPIPHHEEMFNNFFSSKKGPLRGLGLSIVQDFMADCGGELTYEHSQGFNIFHLRFPLSV